MSRFAGHHRLDMPAAGDILVVGPERDSGGFGRILPVATVAGRRPSEPLLVKEFTLTPEQGITSADVLGAVTGLQVALEGRPDDVWITSLLALPYWVGDVEIAGVTQLIVLMRDLSALGYESGVLVDADRRRDFVRRTTVYERIDLAHRFAETASLLAGVPFVHGDHHPENVMINIATGDVQVIDFDAGVVLSTGAERPLTPGHPDAYMPPEIKGSGTSAPGTTTYDLAAERWPTGLLIGQMIIGMRHPAYFLRAISAKAILEYARSGARWPAIDTSSQLFRAGAQHSYPNFRVAAEALPSSIVECFARFFAAGLNGGLRPSPGDWLTALDEAREPPVISRIAVSTTFALEGSDVRVEWATSQAEHVECVQLGGRVDISGEASLTVDRAVRPIFRAFNRWGATEQDGPLIRVVPLPRLEFVPVPTFPGLHVHSEIPMVPHPFLEDPFPTAPNPDSFFAANRQAPRNQGPQLPSLPPLPDLLSIDLLPPSVRHRRVRARHYDWFRP